jgi:hypothetical protein
VQKKKNLVFFCSLKLDENSVDKKTEEVHFRAIFKGSQQTEDDFHFSFSGTHGVFQNSVLGARAQVPVYQKIRRKRGKERKEGEKEARYRLRSFCPLRG